MAKHFEKHRFPGFIETVPAYASLTIFYDVFTVKRNFPEFPTAFEAIRFLTENAVQKSAKTKSTEPRTIEIPVNFDKTHALDLDFVASSNNLPPAKVIEIFTAQIYRVFMLGFLPGFVYMGEIDERIAAPRKETPRTKVPKGSVGIAGRQTGIYPFESPGGWQIIGKTDVELFTPNEKSPTFLNAGDLVKFVMSKQKPAREQGRIKHTFSALAHARASAKNEMSIKIIKEGLLTTIQDLGRKGFRRFGINPNGAMDKIAVRLINILLQNDENEAVFEMHFPAPEILFDETAVFALGGADFGAKLNHKSLENWRIYMAEKGSTLKFTEKIKGNRVYLSIKGGFKLKTWLKSASTNLTAEIGGFEGRKLQQNDRISFNQTLNTKTQNLNPKISNSLIPFYSKFPTVRIIESAETELLTGLSQEILLKNSFTITQNSNRMGFRLNGTPLYLLHDKELVSSAVNFGTIQLLPDGQLIILMADHQTTGGYPRIASVFSLDLPLLAQLGANDKVAFHLISLEEAENLLLEFENNLNWLKTAVKFL